jgi:hypothetical protein
MLCTSTLVALSSSRRVIFGNDSLFLFSNGSCFFVERQKDGTQLVEHWLTSSFIRLGGFMFIRMLRLPT